MTFIFRTVITSEMKTYLKEADTSFPFDFSIWTEYFDADAESGQFAVDIRLPGMDEKAVAAGEDVTATPEERTFGGNSKDYVRLTGEIPLADTLEEGAGYIGLRYIDRHGKEENYEDFLLVCVIKPDKVYAHYVGTDAGGYPVVRVWMYLLNENFTFDDSKFTFKLNDLLGRGKFTGNLTLEGADQSDGTLLYKDFAVTVPDDLPKGYYAVSVKYDGEDIYDLYDPEELLLANYNSLTLIPDRPEIISLSPDENDNMIGAEVGGAEAGASVSAILYDCSDPDNFDAIKTVTLVKGNDERNIYYFTKQALQGVNLTKEYQIVFLCDNQIMDICNNYRINFKNITGTGSTGGGGGSAQVVSKPVASPQGGSVEKGRKVTLTCATADAKIYYTTDGTNPTTSSKLYTAPIEITEDTVIKAIGVKSGYRNSGILTASYTVKIAGEEEAEEETAPGVFTDISSYDWAREAILWLAEKGIIKGTSETTFAPGAQIKRADYLLLMVRMLGLTADVKDNFPDVAVNKYYYHEIGIAKALGLTTGVGGNKFDPEISITRQDMFVLACRMMEQQGIIRGEANLDVLDQFSDRAEIADYAQNDLAVLISLGLIKGSDGKINPRGNATRAETAVFIYRLAGLLKQG